MNEISVKSRALRRKPFAFSSCVFTFPRVALARVVWPLPFHRIWSCRTDKAAGLPSSDWSSYATRVTACWPGGWPPRSWSRGVAAVWRGPGRLNNTFLLLSVFHKQNSVLELRCLSLTLFFHLNQHFSPFRADFQILVSPITALWSF